MLDWYYRKKWDALKELVSGRQVWTGSECQRDARKLLQQFKSQTKAKRDWLALHIITSAAWQIFTPNEFSICAESENAERSIKITDNQKIFDVYIKLIK